MMTIDPAQRYEISKVTKQKWGIKCAVLQVSDAPRDRNRKAQAAPSRSDTELVRAIDYSPKRNNARRKARSYRSSLRVLWIGRACRVFAMERKSIGYRSVRGPR